MSTLDGYKAVMKDVQAGKFKPLYVLHGEEGFFIDRVSKEIEERALQEHERDFNLTILYGRDCDAEQVKDTCLRYPMMAERQVVILREAQSWRPDQWDKLEAYASKPTPTTVLVIGHKHKKLDGRKGFAKAAAKTGVVFHSEPLKDHELPKWIQAYVTHHKRKIGQSEAMLLAEHLGSDLGKTAMEVEKLALVTQEGANITADTIQRYVGISKEYSQQARSGARPNRPARNRPAQQRHRQRQRRRWRSVARGHRADPFLTQPPQPSSLNSYWQVCHLISQPTALIAIGNAARIASPSAFTHDSRLKTHDS
ncbi:MAG: DNA polymerase III subunit delta [Flavobacteriales bacterium]|nr:DNA polymerase III subunit delta [Flavobacteriales bacterium]